MNDERLDTLIECLYALIDSLNTVLDRQNILTDRHEMLIQKSEEVFIKMREEFWRKVIEYEVNKEIEKNIKNNDFRNQNLRKEKNGKKIAFNITSER